MGGGDKLYHAKCQRFSLHIQISTAHQQTSPEDISIRPLLQTSPADLSSRTSDVVRRISAVPLASAKMFNEHRAAMAPVRSKADDGIHLKGDVTK